MLRGRPVAGKGGFTLVELLVVVGVIAVLMAILLPVLGRARLQARAVVCRGRLRQWSFAFAQYEVDNDGHTPHNGSYPVSDDEIRWPFFEVFHTYCGGEDSVLLCPMTRSPGQIDPRYATWRIIKGDILLAWTFSPSIWAGPVIGKRKYFGSYGFSDYCCEKNQRHHEDWVPTSTYYKPGPLKPSRVPLMADSVHVWIWPRNEQPPNTATLADWPNVHKTMECTDRHNGGVNYLFRDGSVRKVGIKEQWTLLWNNYFDPQGPWTLAGGVQPEDWPEWMRGYKDY